MIILRQNNYSKAELNKLGQETDKDIREAVKGTKAEKKVDKILDKSTKEMKEATQKQYAAISDEGSIAMRSKDALEEARNLGYTKKAAVKAAKRLLDKARDRQNEFEKDALKPIVEPKRTRIGFIKDKISDNLKTKSTKDSRIGFIQDWSEISGSPIKLGFKKFSKQDREIVPVDIVKKVKDGGGVIQKDHNGDWRIISMKTKTNKSGKPEFWDARYDSKESAQKALGGYFANKH